MSMDKNRPLTSPCPWLKPGASRELLVNVEESLREGRLAPRYGIPNILEPLPTRIRRGTARLMLRRLLERVAAINNTPGIGLRITKIAVFGGYLGTNRTLGDIDIFFAIENIGPKKGGRRRLPRCCEGMPPEEVLARRLLAGRSRRFHLLKWKEEEVLKYRHQVLFRNE